MDKRTAIFISVALLCVYWYFSPSIFSWGIGVTLPIIGFVGDQPFAFLGQYTVIVGGSFAVLVYYLLTRKGKD